MLNKIEENISELYHDLFKVLESHLQDDDENEDNPNVVAPTYHSVVIIDEAKSLSEKEKTLVKDAALIREDALTNLRANNIEEGKNGLVNAKEMISNSDLAREGVLIANTYQNAAEAFSYLKGNDFQGAIDSTIEALEIHKKLFLEFNHDIETRRIHLVKNITKVMNVSKKYNDAFELSINMVQYIIDENEPWQYEYGNIEAPDKIGMSQKYFVLNQFLNEIIFCANNQLVGKELILSALKKILILLVDSNKNQFTLFQYWLEAFIAYQEKDEITFVKRSTLFYQLYSGELPAAYDILIHYISELVED